MCVDEARLLLLRRGGHRVSRSRLRARELGDRFGAFTHGVLGELSGQDQPNRGLDLARRHRRLFVVPGELGRLGGDLFEDVVDERVHNGLINTGKRERRSASV